MLFKNEKLRKQFDLYGYVVIPFLNQSQVNELRQFFFATHPQIPEGFYSSSFNADVTHKQKVNTKIEEVLSKQVSAHFNSIKKLGSCFLNKQPGAISEMPIHQDWTVVDEPRFDSITIWIPLQDVDETNGAVQVIDGSHRFSTAIRSPSLPDPFKNVQDEMRSDLKLLKMKAGEAFIFSQALLHASPANKSNEPRIAVTYGLIDSNAQLMFYHNNGQGKIEQYYVEEDFFQRYNTQIGERPQFGSLQKIFDYEQHFVTPVEYRFANQKFKQQKAAAMYKMLPIFKDEERQQFFEREGYCVFPLLNTDEVNELKSFYESLSLKDEKGFGFHVSMDNSDKEMCRKIREKIWSVALPRLGEHLKEFKPFVASFVMKEVNPKGVVPAHQDWSFVDREDEGYSSITCWIALVDTNLDNGGMGVIRGSHKFMQNHRPSPSPQCPVPLSEHMFSIFPYLHTIDVKAGEVLMFDNRTFHASPPNTSNGVRLAAGVGVTQAGANLVHYYMKPDGEFKTMLRYNVDEEFFLKYENATLSRMYDAKQLIEGYGEPVEVPYEFTKYSSDELIEIIKASGNDYNVPMTEKLAKLFGYTQTAQKQEQPKPEPIVAPVVSEPQSQEEWKWVDDRTFFEKYTPLNIAREIKKRLAGV
ncbi:MAG: phytanoyl-CoA dioxygenase family protein [Chitinophagales bacterium]|nr:phytanoyl-CoA dioxygenase family protein [Chitinophagales bacterium]